MIHLPLSKVQFDEQMNEVATTTHLYLFAHSIKVHLIILLRRSGEVGKGRCLQVIDTLASIDRTIAWSIQDVIRGVFRNKSGGQTSSFGRLKEGTGTTNVSILGKKLGVLITASFSLIGRQNVLSVLQGKSVVTGAISLIGTVLQAFGSGFLSRFVERVLCMINAPKLLPKC